MPKQKSNEISRDRLAELLNEDLSREYQAIIAYVVYSRCSRALNTWTSPLSWKFTPSKSSIMP